MLKFIVKKENGKIFISFKYNGEVVAFVKTLKVHKWNPEGKNWEISEADLAKLKTVYKDAVFEDWKPPVVNNTISKTFLDDIVKHKVKYIQEDAYKQSRSLKPSNLHCERRNVYILAGLDEEPQENIIYNYSEQAKTGTMRHESIQDTLIRMTKDGSDFEYIDVGEYVKEQQAKGFCKELRLGNKHGAEQHLYNDTLHLSFLCDGVVKYKPTGEYYLFEFKNKTSEKAENCKTVFPDEHLPQITIYCECLNLTKVLLLIENRDTCELIIPPIFEVTPEMKKELRDKINYSIDCYNKKIIPEKPKYIDCHFCTFKNKCKMYDDFGVNPLTNTAKKEF